MRTVTGFCTATVIEVLGSMTTVNSDAVKRILPYVVSGLQSGARENLEQKVSLSVWVHISWCVCAGVSARAVGLHGL